MVGPDYVKPTLPVPPTFKEATGWVAATPSDDVPKGAWWTVYNDPTLNALAAQVAVNNATLAADYDNYQEALETVKEERGNLFPSLGLTGSATRAGNGAAQSAPSTSGSVEGSADWTPDIWGKIRRQVQGDQAAAAVSAADLANATLSAQATLAADYVDLRASDAAIVLYQQTVAADQESLRITQNQVNAGVATPLDVVTAQAQLDAAQADLTNAGEARAQYEHAIAVLVGHAPSELSIPPGPQIAVVPVPSPGVPSQLLQRRPDIAAAERGMAEANEQIGVAVGAFYPDISLSALGGYSGDPVTSLFKASNALWSLGSSASETLFDGGTRTAAVQAAKFSYNASVQSYRATVLAAFQQVEDELSNTRILAQQAGEEAAAVAAAQQEVQIALNEYQAGTVAYTTVVSAQLTLLGDQQAALAVQQNRLLASIALVEALGGGYAAPK
jgi:NodT family efflux transporter outer membrane factor (OMF) lipoprotein